MLFEKCVSPNRVRYPLRQTFILRIFDFRIFSRQCFTIMIWSWSSMLHSYSIFWFPTFRPSLCTPTFPPPSHLPPIHLPHPHFSGIFFWQVMYYRDPEKYVGRRTTLLDKFWRRSLYICSWWRYCKAVCDAKLRQICRGKWSKFSLHRAKQKRHQ